jgi:hypothetical protein
MSDSTPDHPVASKVVRSLPDIYGDLEKAYDDAKYLHEYVIAVIQASFKHPERWTPSHTYSDIHSAEKDRMIEMQKVEALLGELRETLYEDDSLHLTDDVERMVQICNELEAANSEAKEVRCGMSNQYRPIELPSAEEDDAHEHYSFRKFVDLVATINPLLKELGGIIHREPATK